MPEDVGNADLPAVLLLRPDGKDGIGEVGRVPEIHIRTGIENLQSAQQHDRHAYDAYPVGQSDDYRVTVDENVMNSSMPRSVVLVRGSVLSTAGAFLIGNVVGGNPPRGGGFPALQSVRSAS